MKHSEEKGTDAQQATYHLGRIDRALTSPWRAFLRGAFQGLGSVVGAALLLVLIGWILNLIGVIPAFERYVGEFQETIEDIRSR